MRRTRKLLSAAGLLALFVSAACGNLQQLAENTCGNDVLEPGEDCEFRGIPDNATCGEPNTPQQCRWTCPGDTPDDSLCPTGTACGVDNICREHSGILQRHTQLPIPVGFWLGAADFDGDGYDDLANADDSYVEVVFFRAGEIANVSIYGQLQRGQPSIGDANDDGLPDWLVPTDAGIAVLRGSATQTLIPTTFPSLTIPYDEPTLLTFDALPDIVLTGDNTAQYYPGDEVLALAGTSSALLLPETVPEPESLSGSIGSNTFDKLIVPLVIAQFDNSLDAALPPNSASPEEFVLAFVFEPDVQVYRPSVVVEQGQAKLQLLAKAPTTISTNGKEVVRVLGAIHANPAASEASSDSAIRCGGALAPADDKLDLALLVYGNNSQRVGGYQVQIAYGLGDGRFHSNPCELAEVDNSITADNATAPPTHLQHCVDAIALGHLDDDGLLDIVTPKGIWQSWLLPQGSTQASLCIDSPSIKPQNDEQDWGEAVLVDFNKDGHQDIVATQSQGGLYLLQGDANNKLTVSSRAGISARELTVADYDGDGAQDVAFIEEGGNRIFINVLFGEALATPGEVAVIGALDQRVTRLQSYDLAAAHSKTIDGANELAVQVDTGDSVNRNTTEFATFFGRADRQLQAPYRQIDTSTSPITQVDNIGAWVGHYEAQTQATQVGFVGFKQGASKPSYSVSVAESVGDLAFLPIIDNTGINFSSTQAENISTLKLPSSDQLDQLLIAHSPFNTSDATTFIELVTNGEGGQFSVEEQFQIPGYRLDASFSGLSVNGFQPLSKLTAFCDVGLEDGPVLVLQTQKPLPCTQGTPEFATSALQIIQQNALRGGSGQVVETTVLEQWPKNSGITGFTCINADRDIAKEIVILLETNSERGCDEETLLNESEGSSLWLVDIDPTASSDQLAFTLRRWTPGETARDPQLIAADNSLLPRGLRHLTSGDFNGDGVDDLAAGADEFMLMWMGLPKNK